MHLYLLQAESFFAQTWLRMCTAVNAHDMAAALKEQQWKANVSAVFGQFPGQAERLVYAVKGFDIGPPRPPEVATPTSQLPSLHDALDQLGFWNQTTPAPCLLP